MQLVPYCEGLAEGRNRERNQGTDMVIVEYETIGGRRANESASTDELPLDPHPCPDVRCSHMGWSGGNWGRYVGRGKGL